MNEGTFVGEEISEKSRGDKVVVIAGRPGEKYEAFDYELDSEELVRLREAGVVDGRPIARIFSGVNEEAASNLCMLAGNVITQTRTGLDYFDKAVLSSHE